jgi:protein-tyrosine-phosphatase/predicted ATP-grasp superfamily ATP-dependent carboligase
VYDRRFDLPRAGAETSPLRDVTADDSKTDARSRRALVLDGGSRAAPEVVLSLARAGVAIDLAAKDAAALARHARGISRCVTQPSRAEPGAFVAWLRALDAERTYELIVPASDESLLGLLELAEGDDLRRRAVLASNTSLSAALDKQKTWELAASLGIDLPANRILAAGDPPPPARALPTVLKPQSSMTRTAAGDHKLFVEIARTEDDRARKLARMLQASSVQEQEYVGGTGVGVECLYANGRLAWAFVHERLHEFPLTGGGSAYRRSLAATPEVLAPAVKLLDALRWHGVAMVEFKRTPDGRLVLMEINPRLWGSLALGIDCGVDFPAGLLALARADALPPQPAYRVGYRTRNVEADVLWMKANLRADRSDPLLLTRPVARSALEWLLPLVGRESWDYFSWRDLSLTVRMLGSIAAAEWRTIATKLERRRRSRRAADRHAAVLARARERGVARIVFACYGNICRSPFAAAIVGATIGTGRVASCGTYERGGRSTPANFVDVARRFGVDLSAHRSQSLDPASIGADDLLIVMDLNNYGWIEQHAPSLLAQTTLLGLFDGGAIGIADPYGMEDAAAAEILGRIERASRALVTAIAPEEEAA